MISSFFECPVFKPLVISSSLFWTVVLHACYRKQWLHACAFTAVAFFSLNYHCYGYYQEIDKNTAQFVFSQVLLYTITTLPKHIHTLFCLMAITGLWYAEEVFVRHASELHFLLHIAAVVGMHAHIRRCGTAHIHIE